MNIPRTVQNLRRLLDDLHVSYFPLGNHKTGSALVIREGGRVLALSLPGDDRNVLWTHPQLTDCREAADLLTLGAGGIGGLRLWQAPEAGFMWDGLADPTTFLNYRIQSSMDPGNYLLADLTTNRCVLEAKVELRDYRTGSSVAFFVRRTVELAAAGPSGAARSTREVSLHFSHQARLIRAEPDSRVGLWHLLQLEAGTRVGLPTRSGAQPTFYFNPEQTAGWEFADGVFSWPTKGTRASKIGFSVPCVAGGPFAHHEIEGDSARLFLWDIPLSPADNYVDAPPGREDKDQVVQFWDGFGFCEVEYHSPALSLAHPIQKDFSTLTCLESAGGQYRPQTVIEHSRMHLPT